MRSALPLVVFSTRAAAAWAASGTSPAPLCEFSSPWAKPSQILPCGAACPVAEGRAVLGLVLAAGGQEQGLPMSSSRQALWGPHGSSTQT